MATELTEPVSICEEPENMSTSVVEVERVHLPEDVSGLDKDALLALWNSQDAYIDHLESSLREIETKPLKAPDSVSRREHLLVVRLATKDQEIQELSSQLAELKSAQIPTSSGLHNTLIDPAINLIIIKLKTELEAAKQKLQETQEELTAWKFTPDSVTGKRLMSKCRQLLQENEEIGKMISSGRLAKLESELAMQKHLCDEMKKNQAEMDDFVQELDEDVEGMQSTIYFLQQQLKEAKETISNLQQKLSNSKNIEDETTHAENISMDSSDALMDNVNDESTDDPTADKSNDIKDDNQDNDESAVAEDSSEPSAPVTSENTRGQEEEESSEVVADPEMAAEEEELPVRTSRRGRATPTKAAQPPTTDSPTKRGRATRGQKREADDEEAVTSVVGRGRPKRRRAAAQGAKAEADDENAEDN